MAPTRIPEGFVLVSPRSRETATALLEAADAIKADRQASVRTTINGYHVTKEVAAKYQEAFPEAEVETETEAETEAEAEEPKAEGPKATRDRKTKSAK